MPGIVGAGGVLRNNKGKVFLTFSKSIQVSKTPTMLRC